MRLIYYILISSFLFLLNGYAQYSPGNYWIQFVDKNNNGYSIDRPWEFLSERAIQRREKQDIPVVFSDLPVCEKYIDSLISLSIPVINRSKWFNSVTTGSIDSIQVQKLYELSFVNKIQLIKPAVVVLKSTELPGAQEVSETNSLNYGATFQQVEIHNGQLLHDLGYAGDGIQIAVIDAGFNNVDSVEAFDKLWSQRQILGAKDFVNPGSDVFRSHSHGTLVLSVIGGFLSGSFIGAAPNASFWLLRSEDAETEYPIEEYNWVSAAEFADSAGVDIINSSLGYSEFNDPSFNHSYSDMNGHTTPSSKGANYAASKGMLVIVSAGNQGDKNWKYITSPSDADSALAIAAVDYNGIIANFSSRGPGSDGDIKPNISSVGVGTFAIRPSGLIGQSSGTSLSAPVITGLSACLWQANPEATNMEIYHALQESADRSENPDTIYGYGIPDFYKAHMILTIKKTIKDKGIANIQSLPNPFTDRIILAFNSDAVGLAEISIYNLLGSLIKKISLPVYEGINTLEIPEISGLEEGTYIIQVKSASEIYTQKILKF